MFERTVMTRGLLIVLVALSSCVGDCSSIGGGAMHRGDMVDGAMSGDMRMPSSDVAVVGIDWPFTPTLLWEAAKETEFADMDSVGTPTNFGTATDVAVTVAPSGNKPTFRDPCAVGPALPCFSFDGGDYWWDGAARASLRFLHDGTGGTCFVVLEVVSTGTQYVLINGGFTGTRVGMAIIHLTSLRLIYQGMNGTTGFITGLPSDGTMGSNRTVGFLHRNATASTPNYNTNWRGASTPATTVTGNYVSTVPTGDSTDPLTVGTRSDAPGTGTITMHMFATACVDSYLDDSTVAATWAAIEARTGALPQ